MRRTMEAAFNEWMRRYIETPEDFAREWEQVIRFREAEGNNVVPDYGDNCTAFLHGLMEGK